MMQMKLLLSSLVSLRSRYQDDLEKSVRESEFIFDSAQLMYYKCHKVNF